jgi:predicted lipoprotein with Yx(FWY)xxD motif
MRLLPKVLIPLAVTAVLVAGCGSDDDGSSAAPAAAATTGLVSAGTVDGSDVLVDRQGKTLYTADVEKDGIKCVDACESFWEPLQATAGEAKQASQELDANLSVTKRPGGEEQLTFDGLPLYSFAEEGAGKLEGDGFTDDFQGTHFEWKAAKTSGGSSAPANSQGGGYGY